MIYFVLTRAGYDELMDSDVDAEGVRLRVNDGVLDDAEISDWRGRGADVSVLPSFVDPGRETEIVAAIERAETEFPDEDILVEYR